MSVVQVDTTELEAKLSTARNETQLELLHTVSKGEQAQKASLNTKADSSRLEQYIESAEARRQQVCIHRESVAHSRLPPSPPSSPPETRSLSLAYGLHTYTRSRGDGWDGGLQAAAQAAKERHDDRQAAEQLREKLEKQLSAGLGALEDRTRKVGV